MSFLCSFRVFSVLQCPCVFPFKEVGSACAFACRRGLACQFIPLLEKIRQAFSCLSFGQAAEAMDQLKLEKEQAEAAETAKTTSREERFFRVNKAMEEVSASTSTKQMYELMVKAVSSFVFHNPLPAMGRAQGQGTPAAEKAEHQGESRSVGSSSEYVSRDGQVRDTGNASNVYLMMLEQHLPPEGQEEIPEPELPPLPEVRYLVLLSPFILAFIDSQRKSAYPITICSGPYAVCLEVFPAAIRFLRASHQLFVFFSAIRFAPALMYAFAGCGKSRIFPIPGKIRAVSAEIHGTDLRYCQRGECLE